MRSQPYAKNYRQLRKAWHGRSSLLQGPPTGCPVPNISPENLHTGIIVQTEQVIFRNIYACVCVCIYVCNNSCLGGQYVRIWRKGRKKHN